MPISSIGSSPIPTQNILQQSTQQPSARPTDGDSPAVEAAESQATKLAEKTHGGFNKVV